MIVQLLRRGHRTRVSAASRKRTVISALMLRPSRRASSAMERKTSGARRSATFFETTGIATSTTHRIFRRFRLPKAGGKLASAVEVKAAQDRDHSHHFIGLMTAFCCFGAAIAVCSAPSSDEKQHKNANCQ